MILVFGEVCAGICRVAEHDLNEACRVDSARGGIFFFFRRSPCHRDLHPVFFLALMVQGADSDTYRIRSIGNKGRSGKGRRRAASVILQMVSSYWNDACFGYHISD